MSPAKRTAPRPLPTGTGRGAFVLRAHHLLCALGFRGLGYSPEFTANMKRVVLRLRAGRQRVRLTDTPDVICAVCPNLRGGRCRPASGRRCRVPARDRRVLGRLGLSPGEVVTAKRAYGLVRERITPNDLRERICAGCRWLELGYCEEGLAEMIPKGKR